MDPYWILAVVRLGNPLSFSRETFSSVTKDFGDLVRAQKPLVITDEVVSISVSGSKRSHIKTLNATLKQGDVNFLTELQGSDWIFAWIVNNKTKYLDLLNRLDKGEACNRFDDGLKFIGRIHNVRAQLSVQRGTKTLQYSLQGIGFSELDTSFFFDASLAAKEVLANDLGAWLTRLGINFADVFKDSAVSGVKQNNVNLIIPTLLDLIVGKGPPKDRNILVKGRDGKELSATPSLQNEAPFAYLVPLQVGKILGQTVGSKAPQVFSYADIVELVQGIQHYSNQEGWKTFIPDLKESQSKPRRQVTPVEMLGTFLPAMPEFTNIPLWHLFQRYLNPTINEILTGLRPEPKEGRLFPTIVMRQIPFTTEAFNPGEDLKVTKFLNLPRWKVPALMINSFDIGRSDATRINFVHIYGQSALLAAGNNPIPNQIVENPPVRDDLDISKVGLRPYQTTIECWVNDQIGQVPSKFIKLASDWLVGSHLTLNGTVNCLGIQSPIVEGDNLELDSVVYHIESCSHQAGMSGDGKYWTTTLTLTNGMRADTKGGKFPIYPGFKADDNTSLHPGLTMEHRKTTGGPSEFIQPTALNPENK